MQRPSWTVILSAAFLAYISYSMWMIGSLFYPTPCPAGSKCLTPYITTHPAFELSVYVSTKQRSKGRDLKLIWNYSNFSIHDTVEKTVNVTLPSSTLNNGSMWVHVFLAPRGDIAHQSSLSSSDSLLQTMYMVPEAKAYNLIGDSEDTDVKVGAKRVPITHWRSRLTIGVMEEDISFARKGVPQELAWLLRVTPEQQYLPLLYIDRLSNRIRDLMPVNKTSNVLPLTITYTPFSVGKLRLWITMTESIHQLQNLGFSEKDTDEVKGIFADTNFYILMMTFMVSALHLLFDFLAFKNDISYWKERKTMVGLSTRAVVWRCVSTIIIFLYLLDEDTSMLVLVPSGIGAIIELWKVSKAFKVKISWTTTMPSISFGEASDKEKETQAFDAEAMYYLSFLMIPLSLCGAVYSLLYTPHKSWYSWCLQSLVHGVYMFGFLFMLPQLFVNYKLKSVAHLPWRAFMYKAFNTFIDDIFAFIITMPTAHRLACFRDDFIFIIYLYQRWLYPVDKTRVNEFGQSFEDQDDGDMKETKKSK